MRPVVSVMAAGLLVMVSASGVSTQSPPPDTPQDLTRAEVLEADIAVSLPESWTVEVEMEEISRVDMEPGVLIGTSILVAYGPGHLPMCGLFVQESSEPLYWLPGVLGALASGGGAFREGEDHTPVPVELPAGTTVKVVHVSRSLVDWPLGFVEYFIAADDRFYVLFCATLPSLAPTTTGSRWPRLSSSCLRKSSGSSCARSCPSTEPPCTAGLVWSSPPWLPKRASGRPALDPLSGARRMGVPESRGQRTS